MTFVSYAQNFEDVLLWRCLRTVENGFYIDVGAYHPDIDSVTRAFYDRGWSGINIEPVSSSANRLRASRPRDITLQLALGDVAGEMDFFIVEGGGLSTMDEAALPRLAQVGSGIQRTRVAVTTLAAICRQHAASIIHFLKVDVEGSERAVLAGADFTAFRPWVVLVEATAPLSAQENYGEWEPMLLSSDYRFVWFDGLNRFYVAGERYAELQGAFLAPPNVFDDFIRVADYEIARRINQAEARVEELRDFLLQHEARAREADLRVYAADGRLREQARTAAEVLSRLTASDRLIFDLRHAVDAEKAHSVQKENEIDAAAAELDAIYSSSSWRLTQPLRSLTQFLRSRRHGRPVEPSIAPNTDGEGAAPMDCSIEPVLDPAPVDAPRWTLGAAPRARRLPSVAPERHRIVHQFHSGSAVGDAITNSLLMIRAELRKFGYTSDIFVEHLDPCLGQELRPLAELPSHDDFILVVHHSMGFDAFPRIVAHPAPKVLVYHNITPPQFLSHSPHAQRYAELGRRQLAAFRPHVIAALGDSDFNTIELRALGFDDARSCMLLFDVRALRARAAAAAPRAQDPRFTILFVGRIVKSKSQHDLVLAFIQFRALFAAPCRLVLVGREDPAGREYAADLVGLIRDSGLVDHVTITGLVSDAELHAHYQDASLFVSLSHHEGFGVPLVEAMAHGVPVLAWPSGAIPYTLGGAGELVENRAPAVVARVMVDLACDPARRADISERQFRSLDRFAKERQMATFLQSLALAGAAPPDDPQLRASIDRDVGFTIIGHVSESHSLASINRAIAFALEAVRPGSVRLRAVEAVSTEDLSEVPPHDRRRFSDLIARPDPVTGLDVVISQHYPVHVPRRRGHVTLALFFWEESVVPASTIGVLESGFDAVLAPSAFVAKVLIDSGLRIPVHTIGHVLDLEPFRQLRAERRGNSDANAKFTFLHVSSCFPRKGVDALLEAYSRAFRAAEPVRLVIKGFPNPHNNVEAAIEALRKSDPAVAEIVFINETVDDATLLDLYRQADAVVLPTRGEGFALPAAEAMAAGIPLIATGFGGHMDFCDATNCMLVDYRFAPSASHLKSTHSVWAEPDPESLAQCLLEAVRAAGTGPEQRAMHERTRRAEAMIESKIRADVYRRQLSDIALGALLAPAQASIRVAWVSTWGVRCGIAEYSRYLTRFVAATPGIRSLSILCDDRTKSAAAVEASGSRITTAWRLRDSASVDSLALALASEDPHVVVLQHQPGLLGWSILADILTSPSFSGRAVVVTLHNTRHLLDMRDDERVEIVRALRCVARVLVHTLADLDQLKTLGIVTNVTLMPHGALEPLPHRANRVLAKADAPLIGSYGFFLPEKGIPQLIEAFAVLRRSWPRARLRLVNAEYDGPPSSAGEIAACQALAVRLRVADAIEWLTEFTPHEQSLAQLAECDVIALAYQSSKEASSASVRMALAAGRPVLVTPLALFDELGDAVFRSDNATCGALAKSLSRLLEDVDLRRDLEDRGRVWLSERTWQSAGERLGGLLVGLSASSLRETAD